VVCVKPARLGGIGAALDVITWCTDAGVLWWVGGMFESGYARGVNTALAALPGRSLPGDLAPPATYLVADVVQAVPGEVDGTTGRLSLPVPTGPGLGPAPDQELFRAFESHRVVVWPGDN
jgi:O-succinylbenzoate synthase